ncbi:hypothetical protein SEA_JORGENSEN_69 [Mycobacterium phage Jorgensen]|nr:hypothetical protein SEA_JORGENSEN_69 [Mycobacterium phage Jorgensen]
MSDPAVEAARQVWVKRYGAEALFGRSVENDGFGRPMVESAREVLKPIRELHRPRWSNCINACCSGEDCRLRDRVCEHCEVDWPCDTAKLIYTTEELGL